MDVWAPHVCLVPLEARRWVVSKSLELGLRTMVSVVLGKETRCSGGSEQPVL